MRPLLMVDVGHAGILPEMTAAWSAESVFHRGRNHCFVRLSKNVLPLLSPKSPPDAKPSPPEQATRRNQARFLRPLYSGRCGNEPIPSEASVPCWPSCWWPCLVCLLQRMLRAPSAPALPTWTQSTAWAKSSSAIPGPPEWFWSLCTASKPYFMDTARPRPTRTISPLKIPWCGFARSQRSSQQTC